MDDDKRLSLLLDVIEKRGLLVTAIHLGPDGECRLSLAMPWPHVKRPEPPPLSQQAQGVIADRESQKSPALARLTPERLAQARKNCRATLGRVLSDEAVADMVEAGQL